MSVQYQNEWAVIALPSRFSQAQRGNVTPLLREARQKQYCKVLLDAKKLNDIDSYGVGFLAREMLKLRELGGELAIKNLRGQPLELFQRMELVDPFRMRQGEAGQLKLLDASDLFKEKTRLHMEKELRGAAMVVFLKGEFTYPYGTKIFRDTLIPLGSECNRFVLDLQELEYVDSSALRELVNFKKMLETSGGRMCMCSPRKDVNDLLHTLHFDKVLEVFPNRQTALENMNP